jgi:(R)-2-hydroxyglutarate---pyruvate transhydrogenase
LALSSFSGISPIYKQARTKLGEILSAFEYFDRNAYELVVKHSLGKPLPRDEINDAPAFVLVETSGGSKEHDEAVRFSFYLHILVFDDLG